jgi:predicted nucleic acid-binding protein
VALIDEFRSSSDVQIVAATSGLMDRALDLYRNRRDKDWGLTDCTSFVVMTEHGLSDALTSDEHFRQAGFRVLLGMAPQTAG